MALEYRALELSREVDLADYSRYLKSANFPHRISWQGDAQVVWVESEEAAQLAREVFERFLNGQLSLEDQRVGANRFSFKQILQLLIASPLTMTILLANVICFPVTQGLINNNDPGDWLPLLTFSDFIFMGGQIRFADLSYTLEAGQWWRLLTPMLLHFGWLHLVFNMLWVWEFGRRIELLSGPLLLLGLVLLSSLLANLTQYFLYGVGLFGGMSGVVFGLIGYAMVWDKRLPESLHGVSPGIYIFMLVYLVVGFTGAIDLLGLGTIANGAHLGGLVAGVLLGLVVTQFKLKQP